jgi:hypothetical protein
VADPLMKPIELAVTAGEVGQESMKQKNQTVQRKIVGPLSPHAIRKISIVKPKLAAKTDIDTELAEILRTWRAYQSHNSRDAVYTYLSKVFAVVTRWQFLDCALRNAKAALSLQPSPPQMKREPFAIVIFCTSDSKIADAKTRSKWSRVLRYAGRSKPTGQRLTDFVKSNGGTNEGARKFARKAG